MKECTNLELVMLTHQWLGTGQDLKRNKRTGRADEGNKDARKKTGGDETGKKKRRGQGKICIFPPERTARDFRLSFTGCYTRFYLLQRCN